MFYVKAAIFSFICANEGNALWHVINIAVLQRNMPEMFALKGFPKGIGPQQNILLNHKTFKILQV
jgi:hypothetical protein